MNEIESKRNELFTYLCLLARECVEDNYEFHPPKQVAKFNIEARKALDTVSSFWDDHVERTGHKDDFINFSWLYDTYTNYCEGLLSEYHIEDDFRVSETQFRKILITKHGFVDGENKKNKKIRDRNEVCYFGIKFKNLDDEDL
jgi:hypothetical protein